MQRLAQIIDKGRDVVVDPSQRRLLVHGQSKGIGGADDDVFIPAQEYDAPLTFAEADDALVDALEKLQPFGLDNPAPVFYTEAAQLTRRRACGAQGAHLQLSLRDGDRSLDGIAVRSA